MKRYFLLFVTILLLSTVSVEAQRYSYTQIHKMPKSIERDYYIWRYLNQKSCTKKEALSIIKDVSYISYKIKKAYKKKTGKSIAKKRKVHKPISKKAKKLLKAKQKHAKSIIRSKTPFKLWLKESSKNKIFVFNNSGKSGRKLLNHKLPKKIWQELTTHASFNRSISLIKKENLKYLAKSFLYKITKNNRLSYDNLFYLGFNALNHGYNSVATKYFSYAIPKGRHREDMDRAIFWKYMANKSKSGLRDLVKSYDINIYTLLARDILKLKYPTTITPTLPKAKLVSSRYIKSPIYWTKLRREIRRSRGDKSALAKLAKKYESYESIGYYTYIKAKASREKDQYFPMPYRDLIHKLPKSRQAILYAIARQESRFIPGAISSSYALGMMQIMPFLVDDLAKKRKEHIDYDDMFDPRTSIKYANEHMNYLTKWLHHPLFIAYAYNAGIGYTRRMLRTPKMFRSSKGHEPYYSLEVLGNSQARRYGKHVMANYVIYMNKLGVNLRVTDLIKTLHIPSRTDKFRK